MGSNGASGGGGYRDAQKDRKKSVGGTRVGFEGTYKSDINPNKDFKAEKKDNIVGGNGDGNQVVQSNTVIPPVTPTNVEVSQSSAADAQSAESEENLLYKKRKVKAVGRSQTILTSSTGASGGLTLGKPSLLGQA